MVGRVVGFMAGFTEGVEMGAGVSGVRLSPGRYPWALGSNMIFLYRWRVVGNSMV